MSFKIHRDLASLWMNSKLLLQFASNRCPRSVFDQGLQAICDTVWTIFLSYLTPIISQPKEVYYGYTCILGSHDTMKGVLQIFGLREIFGSSSYLFGRINSGQRLSCQTNDPMTLFMILSNVGLL